MWSEKLAVDDLMYNKINTYLYVELIAVLRFIPTLFAPSLTIRQLTILSDSQKKKKKTDPI